MLCSFYFIFNFKEKENERESERERERATVMCCSTYWCIHWLTLVCAPTGDRMCNLGVWGGYSNQLSYPDRACYALFKNGFTSRISNKSTLIPNWKPQRGTEYKKEVCLSSLSSGHSFSPLVMTTATGFCVSVQKHARPTLTSRYVFFIFPKW